MITECYPHNSHADKRMLKYVPVTCNNSSIIMSTYHKMIRTKYFIIKLLAAFKFDLELLFIVVLFVHRNNVCVCAIKTDVVNVEDFLLLSINTMCHVANSINK